MRAPKVLGVAVLAASAVMFGACGSGGSGVDPNTPTTTEFRPPSPSETANCDHAMLAYRQALVSAPKDTNGAPVLDPIVEDGLQLATLHSCTREQWLVAVRPYANANDPTAIANVPLDQIPVVLRGLCENATPPPPQACL